MCTSFVYRGNDTLIAMNYDFYGNNLQLAPYSRKRFLVTAYLNGRDRPLFGIRSDGVFVNQQLVPACKEGGFRKGDRVVSTMDFVEQVLSDRLPMPMARMEEYLDTYEMVSPPESMLHMSDLPRFHLHVLLADVDGRSYIIEPGRGNLSFERTVKSIVMSNCSLYEASRIGRYEGFGADRQRKAEELLEAAGEHFRVEDAFAVLEAVQMNQYQGFCSTEFSLVYSAKESAVYYCYNREFDRVNRYQLEKSKREEHLR